MAPKFIEDPEAVKRVSNPLPAPEQCNRCNKMTVLVVNNSTIYGKQYGKWPFAYLCSNCHSYVGMHPNTFIPLGTLADEVTRAARRDCKVSFESVWKTGLLSRSEAYKWLAQELGISPGDCHFGWFEADVCFRAKTICEQYLEQNS